MKNKPPQIENTIPLIVVSYPIDYDGELHIKCSSKDDRQTFTFEFTHVARFSEWATLVEAAKAIVAQDDFIKSHR